MNARIRRLQNELQEALQEEQKEAASRVPGPGLSAGIGQASDCCSTAVPRAVVIVGLTSMRKLLNGETVETLHASLLPDDDLWNAKRRSDWVANGCPEVRTQY